MKKISMFSCKIAVSILLFSLLVGSEQAKAYLIENGNFETGDTTSWTTTSSPGAIVTGPSALAGTYSFELTSGGGKLTHAFDAVSSSADLSFLFSMEDPGGPNDRGLNAIFVSTDTGRQINLRVVDLGDDGDGDVQIFSTSPSGWQTVLSDAVVFGTAQTMTLTMNSFGAGIDYAVSVDSSSSTGINYYQQLSPGTFDDLASVSFESGSSAVGYNVDNLTLIPEPSSVVLLLVGAVACLLIRRQNNARA